MAHKPILHTSLSPALLHLYDLSNSVVVIIDVFRATSTIASVLFNGAKAIIPVDSVAKAIEVSKNIGAIAAGERDGKIADGLQYGNSPLEYPRTFIENKTLVLTTTNGTRLLQMALDKNADTIISGSFPNLTAVCDFLVSEKKNVVLGCAGWKDRFNLEDTLFAGAVIHQIKKEFEIHCDSSLMAESIYAKHKHNLLDFAPQLTHYHRLVERFGLIEDIKFCLTPDTANVLPLYVDGKLIAK
ncbi:MAG TPA: 2-phosphosulfolactate phosphatase [Chitinophagaceae bacterium]|jgi:2-phosphosulfolactate phosphatase|nr:2-phosphosulfolactate phosphatase [Chitinophagaceae bacterium]HNA91752.1 2-phosphosulfolactate phosphatase [Chitinophagaceae bacterium]HNC37777.1 2-phosphosulfolactate phosphatase [Chitinophagaceae bacterium]HNF37512.1 2-phosphosulfolactate phosphatase [Chitinophagaceae bacterium]HNF47032.1 2-phosphosulfolactate phosphatase [Chitinophagaceae bacterium]